MRVNGIEYEFIPQELAEKSAKDLLKARLILFSFGYSPSIASPATSPSECVGFSRKKQVRERFSVRAPAFLELLAGLEPATDVSAMPTAL